MQPYVNNLTDTSRYLYFAISDSSSHNTIGVVRVEVVITKSGDKVMHEEGVEA